MTSTSVRRRQALDTQFDANGEKGCHYDGTPFLDDSSSAGSRRLLQSLPSIDRSLWPLIFLFFALVLLYVHSVFTALPAAVTINNADAGQFIEERARKTLNDVTAFGSRPVGSKANEELTVDYLVTEITQIQTHMDVEHHTLDIDVQRVSGTFAIDFLGEFTSCYNGVNNVIVKLCPNHGSNDSLLVNCHYDTFINSTGIYDEMIFFGLILSSP